VQVISPSWLFSALQVEMGIKHAHGGCASLLLLLATFMCNKNKQHTLPYKAMEKDQNNKLKKHNLSRTKYLEQK